MPACTDLEAKSRVLLIACGALAREVLAVLSANRLEHITLQCLPAELHLTPERIPEEVRRLIRAKRDSFDEIFVVYGDCGTGGRLDLCLDQEGVSRIAGPHCYSMFMGTDKKELEVDVSTFYLTDFLARQFESFVIKPLGLDRWPELASTYFSNYEKLVYLAQTIDPELDRRAEDAARRLCLAYERRQTGYGDLSSVLAERFSVPELPVHPSVGVASGAGLTRVHQSLKQQDNAKRWQRYV
ncbi:MAG: DUF1638 domain-containing protein [Hyphomicrobiaceae bacterium]